uniref:Uncharacterized protein n=1 Tax=Panagrolaimus sp. JU765 TaxID=591449 RepID=A0AC34PV63_9BILA
MALIARLIILASVFVTLARSQTCTKNAINVAQNAFNGFLGLDASITWSNPVGLALAVQNQFITKGGTTGLIAVCNAYNLYLKSLSDAGIDYKSCLDPAFIIQNDNDPATGYGYAGIMNMIGYQCGAGLYPALTRWDCIKNTYSVRNATLLSCLTNLHLDAGSNATAACSFTKTAILCWQQQFIQTCNNDNEVSYYACQTIRSYTAAAYGECDDRCLIYQAASFAIDQNKEQLALYDQQSAKAPGSAQILYEKVKKNYIIM